jgi:hypothetical protein
MACDSSIFCIADAMYVVCPECKVISPTEAINNDDFDIDGHNKDGKIFGAGLGFTYACLLKWQTEIIRNQKMEMKQKNLWI